MFDLEALLTRVEDLPALPERFAELMRALSSDETGVDIFVEIVQSDPAIAAAVMRLANSPARAATAGSVTGLRAAIPRLGVRGLRRVVTKVSCGSLIQEVGAGYGLEQGDLWTSSLRGAIAAEKVARRIRGADADLAYTAALLRDIGKVGIELMLGHEAVHAALCRPDADDHCELELEHAAFGVTHQEVGAAIAEAWRFPGDMVDAIRFHHEPPSEADPLVDVVHVADTIAASLDPHMGFGHASYEVFPTARERLDRVRRAVRDS
jgi:putative nucleotidyltransferase with HDIG domain